MKTTTTTTRVFDDDGHCVSETTVVVTEDDSLKSAPNTYYPTWVYPHRYYPASPNLCSSAAGMMGRV